MLARLAFFLFMLLALPASAQTTVRDVRLGLQEGGGTRFVIELDSAADFRLFVLDNPQRAVIDLPALHWPDGLNTAGRGAVKGWRYGQFGDGTRIVLDLNTPVKVIGTQILPPLNGGGPRLVVDLAPTTPNDFASLVGRNWGKRAQQELQTAAVAPATTQAYCPKPPALPDARRVQDLRPIVVIDPGHGGVDPGAYSVTGEHEKNITLAIARQLATKLEASGYRVVMTRSRDFFVPLPGRVKIAREANADLFISLHADSIRNSSVRGATVYTLSDRATDREAEQLAESENRSDALAGLPDSGRDNALADILTAMSYRASVNGGRDMAGLLVQSLRESGIMLNEQPRRSAGFAVLKAPDIPSILLEMGYLTSRRDADLMVSSPYQRKLAAAIANAVDTYFSLHRPNTDAASLATLTSTSAN